MKDYIQQNNNLSISRIWYVIAILYLIFDYGRPQDIIPIGFIRPSMIITIILAGYIIFNNGLVKSYCKQTQLIWFIIILLALYIPFAQNNFLAYLTTRNMVLFMPFILSIILCINSLDRLKTLSFVSVCILIYASFYSFFNQGKGSGGYFIDENDLSLYINCWFPFCYFLFIIEKKMINKLIYGIGIILGIIAIIVSLSRGGFIGLVSILIFIWLISPRKIYSLIIVSVCIIFVLNFSTKDYWSEMSTITDISSGTVNERLQSWNAAWNMFLHNPLGVGGNNFQVRFPEYQPSGMSRNMWGRAAHSLWFTLLSELGIIGVIIYLNLLFTNIKQLVKMKNATRKYIKIRGDLKYLHYFSLACLASIVGFLTSGTFLSVLYYPHYWYLTSFIVSANNIYEKSILLPTSEVR